MKLRFAFKVLPIVWLLSSPFGILNAQTTDGGRKLTREQKEKKDRTEWFCKARYGIMFHFVPGMFRFDPVSWTSEEWNAHVDAIDVERVAQQAEEIGAGYVIISLGQNGDYYCSPNPVYQKHWGFRNGQYNSRRDLPMDLYKALEKRGIKMMFYVTASPFASAGEASENNGWHGIGRKYNRGKTTAEGMDKWLESLQWYSNHYGKTASGWWVDVLKNFPDGYDRKLHDALRHGNKKTIIASANFELSDYLHGHCVKDWGQQQKRLPTNGRLDEKYRIQWHTFQYLGLSWASKGIAHSTESVANYASEVIKRGGVITFDIGTFDETPSIKGPTLEIPEDQFLQLKAVKVAVDKHKIH